MKSTFYERQQAFGPKNAPSTLGAKADGGISGSKAAGGNPGSKATSSNLGSKATCSNPSSKASGGNPCSKAAGGNLGYKATGGTSSLNAAPGVKRLSQPLKNAVPVIGAMAGISLEESQESSPYSQAVRDSVPEIESRLEPHSQSSLASVPRLDPEATLCISAPLGAGGVSTGRSRIIFYIVLT
jgi:hypothetical protein